MSAGSIPSGNKDRPPLGEEQMSFSSCLLLISPGGDQRDPSPRGSGYEWLKVASSLEQRAEQQGVGTGGFQGTALLAAWGLSPQILGPWLVEEGNAARPVPPSLVPPLLSSQTRPFPWEGPSWCLLTL